MSHRGFAEIVAITEKIAAVVDELKKIDEKREAKALEAKKQFCSIDADDVDLDKFHPAFSPKACDLTKLLDAYAKSLVVWTGSKDHLGCVLD
jgi:hypothetical protein